MSHTPLCICKLDLVFVYIEFSCVFLKFAIEACKCPSTWRERKIKKPGKRASLLDGKRR